MWCMSPCNIVCTYGIYHNHPHNNSTHLLYTTLHTCKHRHTLVHVDIQYIPVCTVHTHVHTMHVRTLVHVDIPLCTCMYCTHSCTHHACTHAHAQTRTYTHTPHLAILTEHTLPRTSSPTEVSKQHSYT